MDKNGIGSNQHKTCCDKIKAAVRNSSPSIRTIRFTEQQHPANRTPSSAKVSLMTPTPLRDRCVRVSRVEKTSPNNPKDRCPRVSEQSENQSHVSGPTINQAKPKAKAKATTTLLPVNGDENKYPTHIGGPNSNIAQSINRMCSEYIDDAGERIRASTNVGVRKPSNTHDSFNDRITNFLDDTKNKLHNAISFTEGSEGKEKRLK